MFGKIFTLIGLWATSTALMAISNEDLLKNMRSRLQPLPGSKGSLIKSFGNHSQSYIYDQALAIISFSKAHDQKSARALLLGLSTLQRPDGSLYFSYYLNGDSPYPTEGDKRFAGAIAWVAMSATHYQNEFKSTEFKRFNQHILHYLQSQMKAFEVQGQSLRAVTFAPSDIKASPWAEDETVALEHNLDAYSAFSQFQKINPETSWKKEVDLLRQFVFAMWDEDRSHFWSGANTKTGLINKSELYLDNQTWSLLALDKESLKSFKVKDALKLNCDVFYVEDKGIVGFMDSKPVRRPAAVKFVWSEGTLGQIMAMNKYGETCRDKSSAEFLTSIGKMSKEDGGISYATSDENPDFTTSSSIAGTAWLYLASQGYNPFEL